MERGGRLAGVAALLMAAPLTAQTRSADGRIVYDAAFLTQFRPANALQRVERVPGFTPPGPVRGGASRGSRPFRMGDHRGGETPATLFRRDELGRNRSGIPFVVVFGDYCPTVQTTLRLGLENATGVPAFRQRTFFAPDRSTRTPLRSEVRKRNQHILPYVTLKHGFG